jgi:hypothetical protein
MLERVLSGEADWRELQARVDLAITQDTLPEDIPNDLLQLVSNLQLDLEMISVAANAQANGMRSYPSEETKRVLRKYQELLRPYI